MVKKAEDIFNFSETADDCVKCGKCIPVCTIHGVNADEVTSPRGFIDLLGAYKRGHLELDTTAKDIFESCFLCTNCVDACPKALPVDMIIEQVRSDIAQKFGIAWYKRAFFMLLRHRWMNDLAFKLGWTFQSCGFKIKAEIDSMNSRFSLPILKTDRLLPSLRKTSFLNSHKENIDNGGKRKVAVFIGCLANYNYVDIGNSLLEILEALEIDAFLAKSQKCCSAPAYFTGDFDTVDANAKFNIRYFEEFMGDVEAIIVPEATCSAMLKIDYEHFFHDQPEWKARAKVVKDKIFMATEWLQHHTHLETLLASKKKNTKIVTYHDPCHARKMQGVHQEPRNLISQNYKIVEMSDPNVCCGFGGVTMQSEKYHFAKAAGVPKAAMIEKTGAEIVSAECSACRMQINASMNYADVKTVFKNPIELIAEALRA
ncbi:MAG: (Fe-S)-binding protein [Epsilonproteobacteria bacterium]|nr:(Fe-S)-binding protein [Campylobacterota bacterium]OIO15972.1 MAG: glycerol-3-phosphate dehydrogenase [Helicobacteraceae bacterium CG1_02_36_14]PIP10589.1 MAG: glycerol-3-phosphate dehydrogenase [Sulfurimonas sp. CG23_combo_of_CG06-09_8_20_14_all_36_33]PIS24321.1 MAG: glycerol-3-phosphate dehydrogenase [Sulfurimonas sp. CG08_land_8_20_14_0_20_36_33]PIU36253.1 MAG: glycerol-3-phosphate dehydrogenase [Sulfurimonas sp. CG07_land_8_20_14_0_80_36_56]PIV04272.1 MAG: glycerol-3-phosphate dehydroge